MNGVTVIGLGEMGSALAGALLRGGHEVTVWNRTHGKAQALAGMGASVAAEPGTAIGANPLVIVCVSDYSATHSILLHEGAVSKLAGRTIVQLSTGTPKEARDLADRVAAHGASYLDGGILAWPSHIGGPETLIYVSGGRASFAAHEATLRTLGGGLTYLGEQVSASAAMFAAVLSYLAGRWIGICHGARICEVEGLSPAAFGEALAALAPALAGDSRHMGHVIASDSYDHPESTLKTAGEDIARLVRHSADANINAEWPTFAAGLFRRAIQAGYGSEEHAALIKILR